MDLQKLKLSNYKHVAVANLPVNVELPFEPAISSFDCLLAFVQTEAQVDEAISRIKSADGDVVLILAYPKGSSKNYKPQINRDSIIKAIKAEGDFRAPRLVSLDDDWSGFSFKYGSK